MLELKDGFVLYHGSYCEVKEPDLAKCAKRKDFGQGFYLTTSKEQADIALQHIERKKCLSKLNVKWRGMISLQERLRMMQQTLPLLLILLGLSGQAKVAFNVIKISLVKIGCRK